jgi:hypothetical protein
MRNSRIALLAVGLLLMAAGASRSDDAAAARKLVDRAMQAQGGEALLRRFPATTGHLKGTFHGFGDKLAFTGEFAAQGHDRHKFVLEAEARGQKIRLVHVLNRNKGWFKLNDDTEELDKEELAEAQEEAYAGWVCTLVPLKEREFTLTPLGEVKVGQRAAQGVRVSPRGRREVNLFFDQKTGLLVKTEARVKDDGGQEVTEETLLNDYRDVQGTRQAMRIVIRRDGQPYLEAELTSCQLVERLDDSVFARP